MERPSIEFDGESTETSHTHEPKPPKRPDMIPLSDDSSDSTTTLLHPDCTDAPISGRERVYMDSNSRSAQFWASYRPTWQFYQAAWWRPSSYGFTKATRDSGAVQVPKQSQSQPQPQSRHDVDASKYTSSRAADQTLLRELEELRLQIGAANDRAEQAERVAEGLERQLKSGTTDDLTDSIRTLRTENAELRAELEDARSHIFSLQPYRKELTPEEVGQEFDDLVNRVTDWVAKVMDPILDDDDRLDEILKVAKKRPSEIQALRKNLHGHGDLVQGSLVPETDIDILLSIVMRFLLDNIFQTTLFRAVPNTVVVLSLIEGSLQTNVEPKRDLFAFRTWRAEALTAVIASHDYQRARATRIKELTVEVATIFKPFKKDKDWSKLCYSCQDEVITPAINLHEKLLTFTHHFYLDLNPYVVWNARQELETSQEFFDSLPNLKCENILQNRRPFNVAKLDPRPTREQLYRDLTNVITVVPGLYMRQVGRGDAMREPTVVRMQQVLVAWGPQERREKFMGSGQKTLLNRLYYLREKA